MKKLLALVLALSMMAALVSCGGNNTSSSSTPASSEATTEAPKTTEPTTAEPSTEAPSESEKASESEPAASVMSYDDYVAADLESEVTVECYVQAHQSWWDNKITVYAADEDGAYFLYNMACEEADAEKLVPGTKIRVKGFKAEWSGEVEITDATFEIIEGSYIADPVDLTDVLGTDKEADYMNRFFTAKGLKVEAANDSGAAFLYNWDGSGTQGDDLYFNVSLNDKTFSFTVESYLCGKDTDVYKAVEALKVGDVIDVEGFLYWYNGINPHITSVLPAGQSEPVSEIMSYEEYAAADLEEEVTVECYVQAHQSWWDNKITVYAADKDGAYFLYNMACTEDEAENLTPGTKIIVHGYKSEWSGEVEIIDAEFKFADDETFIAEAMDVTDLLGKDELIDYQNRFVEFKGMTVEASKDADGKEVAFLYNWDGSGEPGSDLYFNVSVNGETYNFCVESYLCDQDTDVYKAVEALNIGDTVDLEGFLYWYNGVNPHITSCTVE